MHRIPSLQWKTWVRLAFVEAGSDWRSLNKLEVEDGVLRDFLIVPCGQEGAGVLGVPLERAERRRRGPQRAHERRLQCCRPAPASSPRSTASTGCTPGKTAWAP
jgi:hypothetical protein